MENTAGRRKARASSDPHSATTKEHRRVFLWGEHGLSGGHGPGGD